jgi:hypothetical protein
LGQDSSWDLQVIIDMAQHKIYLIGGKNDEAAIFIEDSLANLCQLVCEYREKRITAKASDFFEAMCQIRIELEKERLIPFCYGASLNVWPSGMGRDMGAGRLAYKLKIGKHASKVDLVNIFDVGPDIIPAYVPRQKEYAEEWLASKKI